MAARTLNGATVRVLREALGISQGDLAARADIARASLSNIERGIYGSSPEVARKLADGMGVPLEAITCGHATADASPPELAEAAAS